MTWHQNFYNPINPQKYVGTKRPFYRSGWERDMMYSIDTNPKIIRWASETIIIKYKHLGDSRVHSYYVDLYFEKIGKENQLYKILIEIKPDASLRLPDKPKKQSFKSMKNYRYRLNEYQKNISKWDAASSFARTSGMEFYILTEKGIYTYPLRKVSDKTYF